jgi:hypothetical protein
MDQDTVLLLLLTLITVSILIGLPIWLGFWLFKYLSKKGYRYFGLIMLTIVIGSITYFVYDAVFPADSFYYSEFKEVTLRTIPKSAVIIKKTASYPDFHGDYCSASLIKISKQDYNNLLNEIKSDKRLHKGNIIGSSEFNEVMGKTSYSQVEQVFNRNIPNEEDHYLTIIFLKDIQSIVVNICVT